MTYSKTRKSGHHTRNRKMLQKKSLRRKTQCVSKSKKNKKIRGGGGDHALYIVEEPLIPCKVQFRSSPATLIIGSQTFEASSGDTFRIDEDNDDNKNSREIEFKFCMRMDLSVFCS